MFSFICNKFLGKKTDVLEIPVDVLEIPIDADFYKNHPFDNPISNLRSYFEKKKRYDKEWKGTDNNLPYFWTIYQNLVEASINNNHKNIFSFNYDNDNNEEIKSQRYMADGNIDHEKIYNITSSKECLLGKQINNKKVEMDPNDPLICLYKSTEFIEKDNIVYAGSNALMTFLKYGSSDMTNNVDDLIFEPSDIDVFVIANSESDFNNLVEKTVEGLNNIGEQCSITKNYWYPNNFDDRNRMVAELILKQKSTPNLENFNLLIRGCSNIFTNNGKKIQLVAFGNHDKMVNIAHKITDVPSAITYYPNMEENMYEFHYPQHFNHMLKTRLIPVQLICPLRREKYEKRGWKFINDPRLSFMLSDLFPNFYNMTHINFDDITNGVNYWLEVLSREEYNNKE
jgi:hypothetical protein